jgi:hypothetical protein
MAEGDREEDFARRWSRRKLEQDSPAKAEEPRPDPPALPPVDELTAESDYTPFLAREVPAELRRTALRKLWRSDPVLANLDGLNDYDDDVAKLGVGKLVRTAYRIGKRLVAQAEEPGEDAADAPEADSAPGPEEAEA